MPNLLLRRFMTNLIWEDSLFNEEISINTDYIFKIIPVNNKFQLQILKSKKFKMISESINKQDLKNHAQQLISQFENK